AVGHDGVGGPTETIGQHVAPGGQESLTISANKTQSIVAYHEDVQIGSDRALPIPAGCPGAGPPPPPPLPPPTSRGAPAGPGPAPAGTSTTTTTGDSTATSRDGPGAVALAPASTDPAPLAPEDDSVVSQALSSLA